MGKFMLFFDQAYCWEQLLKDFFEDVNDKTLTSVEINFLHKIESTTNASRLWDWPTVQDMDILFCVSSIVFMVQTSQYLQMQAEERVV